MATTGRDPTRVIHLPLEVPSPSLTATGVAFHETQGEADGSQCKVPEAWGGSQGIAFPRVNSA